MRNFSAGLLALALLARAPTATAHTNPCGSADLSQICVADTDLDAQNFASPIEERIFLMARKCLDGSQAEELKERFQKTFVLLPATFRKAACAMPRIFLELKKSKKLYSARISSVYDPASVQFSKVKKKGQPVSVKALVTGSFIQIGPASFAETFDIPENRDVHDKFGVDSDESGFNKRIPFFRFDFNGMPSERLLYTMIHEIAHAIDMYNKLVPHDMACEESERACFAKQEKMIKANPFLPFSWDLKYSQRVNAGLRKLCLVDPKCEEGGKNKIEESEAILRGLHESSFGSFYGMENSMEDFAESTTHYFMYRVFGIKQSLHFPGGQSVDFSDLQGRKEFGRKMEYMHKLYSGSSLRTTFEKPFAEEFERELP